MIAGRAVARLLPPTAADGLPRLHLQDGPIDLVIMAEGSATAVEQAYRAAEARFATVLDELCAELPLLRQGVTAETPWPDGAVATLMRAAVRPLASWGFITPMVAVAGAVAETMLAAMLEAAALDRAAVNNGGDIAIHLGSGQSIAIGMVAKPELGGIDLFGRFTLTSDNPARGLATSGWRGRSFSRGIADAVTVLAKTAAQADAAATVIANAVDLPDHPAVQRVAANRIQPDSDLGDFLVTRDVGALAPAEKARALSQGLALADRLVVEGLIERAALHLQGETCVTGERHHG
ncbi:UPF0280 family protein [Acidisoma silvae]|uniref:UPF0280 family protein n=1 Tax=Acidisoma silvae TaxID=2802396 RepID=A0A964DXQ7_9PROT|nr:UPF0280 family protein [Acidisoma silvae]MCB8874530.1 UPF0280 family protein [Acidisoma silvae]